MPMVNECVTSCWPHVHDPHDEVDPNGIQRSGMVEFPHPLANLLMVELWSSGTHVLGVSLGHHLMLACSTSV